MLVLGVLGCVLPLLPIDLTGVRPYLPFPFALVGLALGILGCTGRRVGKSLAVVGIVLSSIALVLGLIMIANQAGHGSV